MSVWGFAASIGSIGDCDNALAETTIGLFKTEVMAKNNPFHVGPYKCIEDVEYATMEWVDWFNGGRLHRRLDYVTRRIRGGLLRSTVDSPTGAVTSNRSDKKSGTVQ
ncbi:hypothetical protein CBI38_31380 (plasmid) [Rhodococcus oxybenzonivorans]|uniref:Integrase catalytic domain-containing protein n=1 Tax=Rhodococcus oxybenzonivorans TaxID=1990687 RepID=A0A2S2C5H8_9NOCA|nr:hypothetical protein CBI38_31380 [Rhodococcus oxybenzonivorans]